MDDIDKLIEKSKWPCGKLICVEPEYIGKFGCDGCRLNFTETRPSRHCTQCEIGQQNLDLIAEVERLKAENATLKHSMKAINEEYKKILPAIDQISCSSEVARLIVEMSKI